MDFASVAKIRRRVHDVHADIGALFRRAALTGDRDLVLPIIVIGAIVVHHAEQRHLVLRREPKRARIEHQIAVGLAIDHEPAFAAMRECHADRHADLRAGAERLAGQR
jgi:hypothetical protein